MGDYLLTSKISLALPHFRSSIIKCQQSMVNLQKSFAAANVSEVGLRFETLGYMFVGPPGVKKSVLLKFLADDCTAMDSTEDEFKAHLQQDRTFQYNRQSENEYWDGFHNKVKVIIMDDYGQAVEDKTNPDGEAMQSIRIMNSFPHELHSASLEEKGNLRNYAKFCLATTNLRKLEPESIVSGRALRRRWNGWYVSLKPEYLTPNSQQGTYSETIDHKKFRVVDDNGNIHPINVTKDMYLFFRYSWSKGKADTSKAYTYDELMDDIKAKYLFNYEVYAQNQKTYIEAVLKTRENLKKAKFLDTVDSIREDIKNIRSQPQMFNFTFSKKSECEPSSEFYCKEYEYPDKPERPLRWSLCPNSQQESKIIKLLDDNKVRWLVATLLESDPYFYLLFASQVQSQRLRIGDLQSSAMLAYHLKVTDRDMYDRFIKEKSSGPFVNYRFRPPLYTDDFSLTWKEEAVESAINVTTSFGSVATSVTKYVVSSMYGIGKSFTEMCCEHPIVTFGVAIMGMFGIYHLATGDKTFASPQGVYEGHTPKAKPKVIKSMASLRSKVPQMWSNGIQTAVSIYNKNVIDMQWEGSDVILGSVLMIKGRVAVCNLHYVYYFMNKISEDENVGKKLIIFSQNGTIIFKIASLDLFNCMSEKEHANNFDNDYVFFEMPRHFRDFRDISQKFVKEEYFTKHSEMELAARFRSLDSVSTFKGQTHITNYENNLQFGGVSYSLSRVVTYKVPTKSGDCGSPLILLNPNKSTHRVVGIHSAGGGVDGMGISIVISQEEVDKMMSMFSEQTCVVDDIHPGPIPQLLDGFPVEGSCEFTHKIGLTHSKVPSPISGKEDCVPRKNLARLKQFDGISPLRNALVKFQRPVLPYVESEPLTLSKLSLKQMICAMPKAPDMSLPSIEQCVYGDCEDEYVEGLNSSSAPGVILKQKYGSLKTRVFMDPRDSTNASFKVLEALITEQEDRLKNGHRITDFFTFNLKSELVSEVKYQTGKSRGFFGAGTVLLVLFNKYFGRFVSCYTKARFSVESAVGINPLSLDWEALMMRMRRFDNSVYPLVTDGDFSAFDCSHQKHMLWDIYDVIDSWYDDCDNSSSIRKLLWHEVVHSRVILGECLFSLPVGMTSGISLTTIINTMIVSFLHRYAFYDLFPNLRDQPFERYVCMVNYGDDHMLSCDKSLRSQFNQNTIAASLKELGYVLTPSVKDAALSNDHFTIDKIYFLKRTFLYFNEHSFCLAPLDKSTIHELPLWTRKGELFDEVFESNVDSSLREAAVWGKEYFSGYHMKLYNAITLSGLQRERFPLQFSHREILRSVYGELISE